MYSVQTFCLYYTTYDVQRQTDTVNPKTSAYVMVHPPASDDEDTSDHELYWYACVLGIHHAKVSTSHPDAINGREIHQMQFLWVQVQWLGAEPSHRHGFSHAVLSKISFILLMDEYAFGFWILSMSSKAVTWSQCLHVAELVTYFLSRTQMHIAFSAMVRLMKQMIEWILCKDVSHYSFFNDQVVKVTTGNHAD